MVTWLTLLASAWIACTVSCLSGKSNSSALAVRHPAVPLIPRQQLIGGDDYYSVRLSPDGKTLAYLAPYMGVVNVWIRRLTPAGAPHPLTRQTVRPIHALRWAFDEDQTLLFAQDSAGEENYRLFALRTKGRRETHIRLLTPAVGVRANLVHGSSKKPNLVVVALNERNRSCHDYFELDIRTGERRSIFVNEPCYSGVLFDDGLNLRLLAKQNSQGGVDYFKYDSSNAATQLLRSTGADEAILTSPLTLDASGKLLYWLDASHSDRAVLAAERLDTGDKWTLYEPSDSDLVACTFHPVSGRPLFVYESYMKPVQAVVEPDQDADEEELKRHRQAAVAWRRLRELLPRNASPFVVSASRDFSVWLVVVQTETSPATYWLYRAGQAAAGGSQSALQFLFSKNEHVSRHWMSARRPVQVPTNDGLKQLCYLSLPVDPAHPVSADRPARPLPMVLFVHGGPWARDRWGFQNEAQLLANRGYAVLQCNYRGSTGFGKAFANAGDGQWGRRMQQDLADAVHWAIRERIAKPDKVAIAGFSYGGYAALSGLTTTPDLYACAVDAVGPSNLLTLMRTLPPYWTPMFSWFRRRMGADPTTEQGRQQLAEVSPYFHADRIRKPLLVAQGANDPRVNRQESDQIVKAARANNASVTYVIFPDEGHGFRRSENNMAFWAIAEHFLQKCLGGRAEPFLNVLQKSSVQFIDLK